MSNDASGNHLITDNNRLTTHDSFLASANVYSCSHEYFFATFNQYPSTNSDRTGSRPGRMY